MKTRFAGLLALVAVFSFSAIAPHSAFAEETTKVEQAIDIADNVNGKVSDVTEAIYDAVASAATDEDARAMLMNGLEKIGIKGGWAKKLGELNKIKGVANAFSKAITALNVGNTVKKLAEAYKQGDKETFHNIVADQLTDLAAGLVGKAVGAAIHAVGGAIIGASALTGPGFIIASGVVLVADWVVSGWVEDKIGEAIRDDSMYKTFQQFGDLIWDMISNKEEEPPSGNPGDPFDGDPEGNTGSSGGTGPGSSGNGGSSGKTNRFQGLKPLRLVD